LSFVNGKRVRGDGVDKRASSFRPSSTQLEGPRGVVYVVSAGSRVCSTRSLL